MAIYKIEDIHPNSKAVLQVSERECFEDLESTLSAIEQRISREGPVEKAILEFFKNEVTPILAYRDNDVNQGSQGPRRLHAVGKLKILLPDTPLIVRLGIAAPNEHPLITVLQVLYSNFSERDDYLEGHNVGSIDEQDAWSFDFSDRYKGRIEGAKLNTMQGIRSIMVGPAINEALQGRWTAYDLLKTYHQG